MDNENDWCFAWMAKRRTGGVDRAALLREAKWNVGDEITVSFLDDDHGLRDKIKRYALQWTDRGVQGMADINFSFLKNTNKTLIRISFKQSGNWSAIGTTCREETDVTKPTMNFGNLNFNSTEEQIRRAVLHEFDHALGLVHEHQSPAAGIEWDELAVLRDLTPRWSEEDVRENIFKAYEAHESNFEGEEMDEKSIMVYPIPARWTKNKVTVNWNTTLSERDVKFIKEQYRKPD